MSPLKFLFEEDKGFVITGDWKEISYVMYGNASQWLCGVSHTLNCL